MVKKRVDEKLLRRLSSTPFLTKPPKILILFFLFYTQILFAILTLLHSFLRKSPGGVCSYTPDFTTEKIWIEIKQLIVDVLLSTAFLSPIALEKGIEIRVIWVICGEK